MFKSILRLTAIALGCGASLSAPAETPASCMLTGLNLHIEVRSEPDDGAWGPTIEISFFDEIQPLNRMIAPESRPIEACWWGDIDGNNIAELVIGVGAEDVHAGGVLVFDWGNHQLQRRTLPALPAEARGNFRYVVRQGGLWAHPIVTNNESTAQQVPYRLGAGGWSTEGNDTGRLYPPLSD